MHRRDFLRSVAATVAPMKLSDPKAIDQRWRTFELTTQIEIAKHPGATRVWVPLAMSAGSSYQKSLSRRIECPEGSVKIFKTAQSSLAIVCAQFETGAKPILTVVNEVATRSRQAHFSSPVPFVPKLSSLERSYWLRSTKLLPTNGVVKENALAITATAKTDIDKARAIYDWIVENTFRKSETRGCGLGDIRYMLESHDLGGKCADLNALFVGLARAAGLPARDLYGIRVVKSELGYKSLGPSSENVTKAQHCRAEVYLNGYGWFAVDPADVRKVMLEEPPGNRPPTDQMVSSARARLFGSWEGNWIAYNCAHDITLPGSHRDSLPFLMYPQAETAEGLLDSLSPDHFRYEITAKEITGKVKDPG